MSDLTPANVRTIREVPATMPGAASGYIQSGEISTEGILESELREYIKVIFRFKRLIIGISSSIFILSIIFAFTRTPLYKSEAQVRISTYQPVLAATKIEDILQERSRETNYFETQMQEVKSRSLADKVLEDPSIRAIFEKKKLESSLAETSQEQGGKKQTNALKESLGSYRAPQSLIKAYLNSINVEPVRRTSLVNISVVLTDPVIAAKVANKHAQAYMNWVRDVRVEQQAKGLQFLQVQAREQRDKIADLERELSEYAEANSIVALNKDENITAQKMSRFNQLLTDSTAKRIEAENLYRKALEAAQVGGAGLDDSSTQTMRMEIAKLEAEYQQLSQKFTDSYPRMMQLKAQIEAVRGSLKAQQEQIALSLKSKAEAAANEEVNFKEELEKQKSQTFDLSRRQVQYNILNREFTASKELLENVLKQIKEMTISVEGAASNISIVDAAEVPTSPTYPKKKVMILIGLALGILSGLSVAFVLNHLDNTVRTPEDVVRHLQIASLGVVPNFQIDIGVDAYGAYGKSTSEEVLAPTEASPPISFPPIPTEDKLPIAFFEKPKSLASESYRTIRTGLLLSQAGEPPRTMLFTSAQSSEGKTTTVLNVAASLSSSGANVLVIDGDLRRPSILKNLGIMDENRGLVDVLTGQRAVEEVLLTNKFYKITLIGSGAIPPNPAELLGSKEMAAVLDKVASMFDYVLIDSPPLLPVTDAMLLSRFVDGVVLVVKGKATPRKVLRDARDRLLSVGARILGVVLNDVNVKSGDYYYYNHYYYSYYDRKPEGK